MLKCKWTHLDITNEETLEDMVNTYTREQDRIIVGGFDAKLILAFSPPIRAVSSSSTILTTICAGVRLSITS